MEKIVLNKMGQQDFSSRTFLMSSRKHFSSRCSFSLHNKWLPKSFLPHIRSTGREEALSSFASSYPTGTSETIRYVLANLEQIRTTV